MYDTPWWRSNFQMREMESRGSRWKLLLQSKKCFSWCKIVLSFFCSLRRSSRCLRPAQTGNVTYWLDFCLSFPKFPNFQVPSNIQKIKIKPKVNRCLFSLLLCVNLEWLFALHGFKRQASLFVNEVHCSDRFTHSGLSHSSLWISRRLIGLIETDKGCPRRELTVSYRC